MSTDRGRALLNSLGTVTPARRAALATTSGGAASLDNPLGLKFGNGARVVDVVTGRRGVVTRGVRSEGLGEIFYVRLEAGELIARRAQELEPAAAPPPAPAGQ